MSSENGLTVDDAGIARCSWGASHEIYIPYHDDEWGQPVTSDTRLFEKICLEGFQSGLSWLTILKKRDAFREAFHGFEIERVAQMDGEDVEKLLQNAAIIRHRGKIEATLNNAKRAVALAEEHGSLSAYFWSWEPERRAEPATWETLRKLGQTDESRALSKDLKKRGWKFVGPTTAYAFMQAMGLVNDHVRGCHAYDGVESARGRLADAESKKKPQI